MQPTPAPEWTGETLGDLVEYAQDLECALASANADKAALLHMANGIMGEETMGKSD